MAGGAFVTGGSGFIGGKLIERLVGEGTTVRALARSDAAARRVAELGAEPVPGDLADRAALASGAAGAETAFTWRRSSASGDRGRTSSEETSTARGTRSPPAARPASGASSTAAPRRR